MLLFVVCATANGLLWCHHPTLCGEPCASTCAANGMVPADDVTTLAAQNTTAACANISLAFGLGSTVSVSGFTWACVEDSSGPHSELPIVLNSPLLCSSQVTCPFDHRTNMDQVGVPCDSESNSRLSLCACSGMFMLLFL